MTFEDSGTGRKLNKTIPKIREREGNDKKALPKFGNGNRMKKSIPFGNGNQRLSFLGMDGNGNSRSPLALLLLNRNAGSAQSNFGSILYTVFFRFWIGVSGG